MSKNVMARMKTHKAESVWSEKVARIEVTPCSDDRRETLKAEREAINKEHPKFNLWGGGARQAPETAKAIQLVKRGWSISKAARHVGIYRSTLQRALKKA